MFNKKDIQTMCFCFPQMDHSFSLSFEMALLNIYKYICICMKYQ